MLAGRNPTQVQAAATSLGLPWRSAALTDTPALTRMLEGVETVINTAGPFTRTAPALMQASIAHRCHYLDLSNEAASFRHAWALNEAAQQTGISIIPGAGFGTAAAEALTAHILTRINNPDTLTLVRISTHQSKTAGTRASTLAVLTRPPRNERTNPHHRDHQIRSLNLPQGRTTVIPIDTGDPYAITQATTITNVHAYASTTMNPARARLLLALARHQPRRTHRHQLPHSHRRNRTRRAHRRPSSTTNPTPEHHRDHHRRPTHQRSAPPHPPQHHPHRPLVLRRV